MVRELASIATAVCLAATSAGAVSAQGRPTLEIARESGPSMTVPVSLDRGYAAVPGSIFEALGWTLSQDDGGIVLAAADEIRVTMRAGSPFFRWDGVVLQLTDPPYGSDDGAMVPLQFLTDFLPRRLPGLYDYEGSRSLLRAGDLALLGEVLEQQAAETATGLEAATDPEAIADPSIADDSPAELPPPVDTLRGADVTVADADLAPDTATATAGAGDSEETVANAGPSAYDGVRVVVIDAGHGGADPGALGPDDIREKTVALGIALHLEEVLRGVPNLEVHMIRNGDVFVDLWDRGSIATEAKGERPGIFVSIHANSFPARGEARGFETYFLSDARTEHERRVSAIENAPISMGRQSGDSEELADVDFILRDLRNYDHAHWSQNLAGLVQEEMDTVHPGPNRGVKQGVLAVLTNALMPSVLVEVGYLSNRDEARLIAESDFHRDSAEAIADAVVRFFERYPPGSGTGGGGSR